MKNLKAIIVLLLCAVLVVGAVGCTTTTTKVITDADIVGSDGRFIYTVIYDDDASEDLEVETSNLTRQLRETFDIRVDRSNDEKAAEPETEAYEILVGNTNRKESKEALEYLNSTRLNATRDFLIKVMGEKIVIVANSDEVLMKAVRYFTTTYAVGYAEFTPLGEGYEYIHKEEYAVTDATLAGNSLNEYVVVTPSIQSLLWSEKVDKFITNILDNAGISLKEIRHDVAATDKEILIGNTNRDTGVSVSGDKWIIKVVGNKLVVKGGNDLALASALDALLDIEEKCIENKEPFALAKDFVLEGTTKTGDKAYAYTWGDEFNGKSIDRRFWQDYDGNTRISTVSCMGGRAFRGDGRDCYVQNGNLYVPSVRYNRVDFQHSQTSTNRTMEFRYGVVEMLVQFPEYPITTALWGGYGGYEVVNGKKVPKTYTQRMELDIVENFGNPNQYAANVHNWYTSEDMAGNNIEGHYSLDGGKYGTAKRYKYKGKDENDTLATGFHLYSLRWTPYEMVFAFDGEPYFVFDLTTYEKGADYTRMPQHLIFGSAYGSTGYGADVIEDDAPLISSIIMDYVRIYQTNEFDSILWETPEKTYSPSLPWEEQLSLTTIRDQFSEMIEKHHSLIPQQY